MRPLHMAALMIAIPSRLVLGLDGTGLIVGVFVLVVPFESTAASRPRSVRDPH